MLDLNSIAIPQPGIIFRLINDPENRLDDSTSGQPVEGILIYPERGQIKVVNEIGARIWSLLDGHLTVREIAEKVNEEYQVDLLTAHQDTLEFLNSLQERDLLMLRSG